MRLMPLVPAGLPPRRSRGWMLGVSLLLHAALVAALLTLTRRPQEPPPAPSYELVFEGDPGSQQPTAADKGENQPQAAASTPTPDAPAPAPAPPTLEDAAPAPEPAPPPVIPAPTAPVAAAPPPPPAESLPGPESPDPTAPPSPEAPAAPPAPSRLAMQSPSTPKPEPEPTPEPTSAPTPEPTPQPRPEPPAPAIPEPEAPPAPTRPEVRLQPPEPPPPPPPLVPDFTPPTPPPPLPPTPRPAAPQRPRTAPPRQSTLGSLSNPMDLDFSRAPRPPAPRVGAARGSVASRSIDLSTGAAKPGPNKQEAFFDARAAKLGEDWMEGVRAYWLRHRYYPQQAAQNGDDGTVDVELVVNRYGRVLSATVKSRSGSNFLDMAAVGTFRGAQLPPIPREVDAPYTVTLTINYILLR